MQGDQVSTSATRINSNDHVLQGAKRFGGVANGLVTTDEHRQIGPMTGIRDANRFCLRAPERHLWRGSR